VQLHLSRKLRGNQRGANKKTEYKETEITLVQGTTKEAKQEDLTNNVILSFLFSFCLFETSCREEETAMK
jgi:hypothetical protein